MDLDLELCLEHSHMTFFIARNNLKESLYLLEIFFLGAIEASLQQHLKHYSNFKVDVSCKIDSKL